MSAGTFRAVESTGATEEDERFIEEEDVFALEEEDSRTLDDEDAGKVLSLRQRTLFP